MLFKLFSNKTEFTTCFSEVNLTGQDLCETASALWVLEIQSQAASCLQLNFCNCKWKCMLVFSIIFGYNFWSWFWYHWYKSCIQCFSCFILTGTIGTTSGEMLFSASQIIYLHVKALSVNTLPVNCMWEQRKASADYGVRQFSRGKQSWLCHLLLQLGMYLCSTLAREY